MISLTTPRLILRSWQKSDTTPLAAMNADPRVMEHFPAPLTLAESEALMHRFESEARVEPFGMWVVERRSDGRFAGYTGLHRVTFSGPLCGRVEIGWRICSDLWGHGYAPEAALACLEYAARIGLTEIVAFTTEQNLRSQRVMQKIGMHCAGAFDHPSLPSDHPLLRHVLYTIQL